MVMELKQKLENHYAGNPWEPKKGKSVHFVWLILCFGARALIVIFLTPPGWLVNINHSLGWYNIWESNPTWLKHGGYALIIHQIALDDEKCQWMLLQPAKKTIVTMFLASNKRVNTWKMIENFSKCLRPHFHSLWVQFWKLDCYVVEFLAM